MASLPGVPGHEAFVRKSHPLGQRPRGQSQPMPHAGPESAIDRDQRIGLVREVRMLHAPFLMYISPIPYATLYLRSLPESVADADGAPLTAAKNPRLPQGPDQL